MKTTIHIAVVALATILLAPSSYAATTTGAIASPADLTVGDYAPKVPIKTTAGTYTTLAKIRQPITIIAFTEAAAIRPELAALAAKYTSRPLTVAQIALPVDLADQHPNATHQQGHLIFLYDNDRIAWNAFKKPDPNTVFLVNDFGKIVAKGNAANMRSVIAKARWLVTRSEALERSLSAGG